LGETLPKLKEGKQGLRLLLVPSDLLFSTHIQQLLSFLANVSIDFSLSAHDDSQEVINRILKNHPKTVKLQVSRNDLPYVWQQSILRRDTEVNHLITGLVIAPDDMVKSFIAQAIGLGGDRLSALSLTPGSLSILHYPAADHRPILQAFNIVPNIYSIIPHPLTPTL
jgi:probable phosphoglycerate mutase